MNEDTKMILDEMAKIRSDLNRLEKNMNEGFKEVFTTINDCYNNLNSRIDSVEENLTQKIDDLQQVTGQNCFELTLLKAKQA